MSVYPVGSPLINFGSPFTSLQLKCRASRLPFVMTCSFWPLTTSVCLDTCSHPCSLVLLVVVYWNLVVWSLTSELLSPRWSKWLEGHWLQLMYCALPKCLCPQFQTRRLTSELFGVVQGSKGQRFCQGTTCFLLWKHLGVLPTPTSDTFSILWTPTASESQRNFRVLPIPSPFQQSPTLLHTPSTPTPRWWAWMPISTCIQF